MARAYSLAHLTVLALPPLEMIDVAARAGYQHVGLRLTRVTDAEPLYPLVTDKALMRETKARLADTGISVLDVELARMDPTRDAEHFRSLLEAAAELGARHVITQLPDPDRSRATDRYAALCDDAAPLGLTCDLEFPSWTETPDLTEATRVLRAVNRPNAGILVDLLHFQRSGSSLDALRSLPREWFHFVHVCDAPAAIPATLEGILHTARAARLFPGEGELDTTGMLGCLPADLPYALEIPGDARVAQVGLAEYARLALARTKAYLERDVQ